MSTSTVEQRSAPTTARVLKNYVGGAWVAPSGPRRTRALVKPPTGETGVL
jgi:hypothetical protein